MTLSFPLRICAAQCFSAEYGTRCSARSAETRESIQLPRTKSKRVRQKTAKRMPIRRTSKCLVHQVYTTQRAYYHCLSFNRFLENWFHFFFTGVQTSLFSISSQWCAWFLFPGANWAWFIFFIEFANYKEQCTLSLFYRKRNYVFNPSLLLARVWCPMRHNYDRRYKSEFLRCACHLIGIFLVCMRFAHFTFSKW